MMLPEQQQPGKGRAGQEELEEKSFDEEEELRRLRSFRNSLEGRKFKESSSADDSQE
jgi:hypothetical protein